MAAQGKPSPVAWAWAGLGLWAHSKRRRKLASSQDADCVLHKGSQKQQVEAIQGHSPRLAMAEGQVDGELVGWELPLEDAISAEDSQASARAPVRGWQNCPLDCSWEEQQHQDLAPAQQAPGHGLHQPGAEPPTGMRAPLQSRSHTAHPTSLGPRCSSAAVTQGCQGPRPTPPLQLGKQYGPVFTVHLGHQKTVVLTGYEAGKEALGGPGRVRRDPAPGPLTVGHVRPAGVFFSSGPRWRAARHLTVRALHGLGVGRAPVANKVLQELRCLTAQLDSYEGRPFPLALLRWAPSNITFTLLFGQRFDYRDPVFLSLLGLVDEVMVLLGKPSVQLFNLYPRLGALLQLHRPVLRKIEEGRAIPRALLEGG
ncbi:PREDICTED: cytochrome P450 2W1-like, partial [Bison bison bison]|uniref:Cytochrome P450 2W1-like n=1 Tax=Bison bison bison TaxID=43346 RepID=A0A6P3J1Y2_BISBB